MRLVLAALMVLSLGACHRSRTYTPPDPDAGPEFDGGFDSGRVGRPGPPDATVTYDVYIDPGCDGGPRPDGGFAMRECNPFVNDCPDGLACYAGVIPPEGPCGEEIFVTACAPEGRGTQGTPCITVTDCAANHACVVTGAGTQCVQVCDLSGGEPSCPRGYICRSTDVPGYGGCF